MTRCEDGLLLRLYIRPKASRDSIIEHTWRRDLVAVPPRRLMVEQNSHLTKFLGNRFRVAKSRIVIEKASWAVTNR